ncbi:hypothetical protein SLE2022_224650 [Rubroshorea leprosula]
MPHPIPVRNKSNAPIQILAEQILREARERRDAEVRPPRQNIADPAELADRRFRKRNEFKDLIRRWWRNVSLWIKYVYWEESQGGVRSSAECMGKGFGEQLQQSLSVD